MVGEGGGEYLDQIGEIVFLVLVRQLLSAFLVTSRHLDGSRSVFVFAVLVFIPFLFCIGVVSLLYLLGSLVMCSSDHVMGQVVDWSGGFATG